MKVSFYATLRSAVGDGSVDLPLREGATVRELLHALIERFPPLGPLLLDDAGELSRHVQVCVNGRGAPFLREQLDTPLAATDEVALFPSVAGGAQGASYGIPSARSLDSGTTPSSQPRAS